MSSRVTSPRVLILLPVALTVVLMACGEESSTSAVADPDGTTTQVTTTTVPSTTATDGDDDASGATSSESSTTTTEAIGGDQVAAAEERVQQVVAGSDWGSSVTDVSVSSGPETIVSITTDQDTFPALDACEAVRNALTGGDTPVAVNVWWAPELAADGGDERQLATALPGGECELVRDAG